MQKLGFENYINKLNIKKYRICDFIKAEVS